MNYLPSAIAARQVELTNLTDSKLSMVHSFGRTQQSIFFDSGSEAATALFAPFAERGKEVLWLHAAESALHNALVCLRMGHETPPEVLTAIGHLASVAEPALVAASTAVSNAPSVSNPPKPWNPAAPLPTSYDPTTGIVTVSDPPPPPPPSPEA